MFGAETSSNPELCIGRITLTTVNRLGTKAGPTVEKLGPVCGAVS